jgi:hypothetical protein
MYITQVPTMHSTAPMLLKIREQQFDTIYSFIQTLTKPAT